MRRLPIRYVGAGLSLVIVGALVSKIDAGHLAEALRQANLLVLLPAVTLYFAAVWVRSMRWRLLLPAVAPPTAVLFRALVVGFSVNNLLPARLGEVARAYLLKRWADVPYSVTLASLVIERVLDGLSLVVLLLVALAFVPTAPAYLFVLALLVGAAFCTGAAGIALAVWQPPLVVSLARRLMDRLPWSLGRKLLGFAAGADQAVKQLRGWRQVTRLVILSMIGWASELGVFYALMVGFRVPGSVALAFVSGAAANFATLVPSSPGYVGTFDAVVIKVLIDSVGVSTDLAAAYAVVLHATLFVPVVAFGSIFLWRANLSMSQVARRPTLPVVLAEATLPAASHWPAEPRR